MSILVGPITSTLLAAIISMITIAIIALTINFYFYLIMLTFVLLDIFVHGLMVWKKLKATKGNELAIESSIASEIFTNIRTVCSFNRQEYFLIRYGTASEDSKKKKSRFGCF
jgi:ABC-type multidrug transport system fused ATPase/permease subunit